MYLYVIHDTSNNHCKIGFSAEPEKRLRTLQTGNSTSLVLYHTVVVPDTRVKAFEKQMHKEINHYKVRGEWFKIEPKLAKDLLEWLVIRFEDDAWFDK
jgi:hypothetical protein